MSLIIGIAYQGGWALVGDSCYVVSSTMRVPGPPKVQQLGQWITATVGGDDDSYAYFRGLTGDEELDAPQFHVERMRWWREQCSAMGDPQKPAIEPDITMLLARGQTCLVVSGPNGQICPAFRYVAIGSGSALALLLLYEALSFEGELPGQEEAINIAQQVVQRVAAVSCYVATPCTWLHT